MNGKDEKRKFAAAFKVFFVDTGGDPRGEAYEIKRRLWWDTLKDYPIDDVCGAISETIRTWEFAKLPPVAVILKKLEPSEPKLEDFALIQAMAVLDFLRRNGAKASPEFSDPITRYLMATRWPYYIWGKHMEVREEKWWVRDFCEAYRAFSQGPGPPLLEDAPAGDIIRQLTDSIGRTS